MIEPASPGPIDVSWWYRQRCTVPHRLLAEGDYIGLDDEPLEPGDWALVQLHGYTPRLGGLLGVTVQRDRRVSLVNPANNPTLTDTLYRLDHCDIAFRVVAHLRVLKRRP